MFQCDAILKWDAERLMAIYPGGEINLDHSGYKPVEVVEYNDEIGDLQGTNKILSCLNFKGELDFHARL